MTDNYNSYNPDDLQNLENKGWQQMQEMLDKHLPATNPVRKTGIAPMWKWLAAACIVMGMGVFLIIKKDNKKATLSKNEAAITAVKPDSLNNHIVLKNKIDTASIVNSLITKDKSVASSINKNNTIAPGISARANSISNNQQTGNLITVPEKTYTNETKQGDKQAASQAIEYAANSDSAKRIQVATKTSKTDSSMPALIVKKTKPSSEQKITKPEKPYGPEEEPEDADKKSKNAKTFNVAFLLNRNTNAQQRTGNSLYDIPAYPSVTASIRVSKSMGITTGITANAPGNFNLSSAGTTMANTMSLLQSMSSNSVSSSSFSYLTQAYYWQVPLTFDYFPVKNVKLYAGANLAFVQKVLLTEQTTTLNAYAASPSFQTTNTPVLKSADAYQAAVSSNGSYYTLRSFDPRMTVGGFYQIKNIMLGAQYSRAVQPSLMQRSAAIPNSNNSIVNLSIGIKLFDKH